MDGGDFTSSGERLDFLNRSLKCAARGVSVGCGACSTIIVSRGDKR